jgi:GSH-dependent disulfide-bond oxidoreductase
VRDDRSPLLADPQWSQDHDGVGGNRARLPHPAGQYQRRRPVQAGVPGDRAVYAPEKLPYAIKRYTNETNRLYGVMNKRLGDRAFLAKDYSVADIASYPWIVPHASHGQNLDDFPHLKRWFEAIKARPATIRAYEGVAPSYSSSSSMSEEARRILFDQTAASVR